MSEEKRFEPTAGALFAVIPEDRRHPEDPGFYIDEEYNVFFGPFIIGKIPVEHQTHSGITFVPNKITALWLVEKGTMKVAEYEYEFIQKY